MATHSSILALEIPRTENPGRLQSQFSSGQSLSRIWLFATPWITARQASLSITNSRSLLKLMPIESVVPSSHLILCRPRLLLPPIPPSIRVFSNESVLFMRWPKYWSFSLSISLWYHKKKLNMTWQLNQNNNNPIWPVFLKKKRKLRHRHCDTMIYTKNV